MKRLFKIGGGLFIFSLVPIVSWVVLAVVLGDDRISNVFSITYSVQFIYQILRCIFGSGANMQKNREKDQNAVWNAIFWGIIFSTIIFGVLVALTDKYIAFFGQDVEFYRPFVLYSFLLLFIQVLLSFIIDKWYFADKEKLANTHLLIFNLLNFALIVLCCLIFKSFIVAMIITLSVLFIYVVVLYICQFEKFKIRFNFYRSFKYEGADIFSSLALFIIYLFGYQIVFAAGPQYLAATNFSALCTDTQWDLTCAVEIVAENDITRGRYNYRKELRNAYVYLFTIVLSSVLMAVVLYFIKPVSIGIALIYLLIQWGDMLLMPVVDIMGVYTQVEYSSILNINLNITSSVLRSLLSIVIISPYCTDIAQIVCGFALFMAYLIIRFAKFKVVKGKLTLKKPKNIKSNVIQNQ